MQAKNDSKLLPLLVLALVVLISTALLAITNEVTIPAREAQAQQRILASKQKIFPEAVDFKGLTIAEDYADKILSLEEAFDADQESIGYLVYTESSGYGGQVGSYLGLSHTGEIVGIDMPSNSETPGLGQRVREEAFYGQALGYTANYRFALGSNQPKLEEGQQAAHIDAVSSATISSTAFTNNLNTCLDFFQAELQDAGKE